MPVVRPLIFMLAAALTFSHAGATELTRAQALLAIEQPKDSARLAGVRRLGQIGTMADAERLLKHMSDAAEPVREAAQSALLEIWHRSGDPVIDQLLAKGVQQMQAQALDDALATFDLIVRRKPDFAEGWNKRATVYFLLGRGEESLKDCDEVLKRNRHHFGALSGAGQIHLQQGHAERALEFFRRALDINPNLQGPAQIIPMLEEHLRDKARNTV